MFQNLKFILLAFIGTANIPLPGQVDTVFRVETMKKNTDFASLTLGLDMMAIGKGHIGEGSNQITTPGQFRSGITIGGVHFWGHADFYVTFPIGPNFGKKPENVSKFVNRESVETGFKYYPWALKPNAFRPYVGMSFQPFIFRIDETSNKYEYGGSRYSRFVSPVQLGITFTSQKFLFTAGARYNWRNQFDYYLSPEKMVPVTINPWNFNIGIVRYMDTDKGYSSEKSVDQLNIKYYVLTKEEAFDSWYVALGPSAALQMSRSPYLKKYVPYVHNQMIFSGFVPELAVGRYFHKSRFNINMAARYMSQNIKAFDTKIHVTRSSFALEAYRFLFNYRGFVPFVGPSLNLEYLTLDHKERIKVNDTKLALGIVLGWDINLSDVETSVLRTNLRYMPGLHLKVDGQKMMYDYLEFNFIQYVYFFNRVNTYKKYRKK
ncbi:MAG: hypothetical protein IPG18_04270 [Saprospiraceae bacterium]|nr:hypothetical protein [Saprospiraceae bacterium]